MPKKADNNLLVGLDIGTSKVVAIVADCLPDGKLEVVGIGSHPSLGLKKGVVVNIDATVKSIQSAVSEAELMAGCQINSVFTGISGSHIRSFNSHGMVAIKDNEVSAEDVTRVIDAAKAVAIPSDQKILHVLPQGYTLDHQDGINDPVGMSGVRLETKVHIVTGACGATQNIIKCVRRCNLEVEELILQQLASSYAVLTKDEKQLGVAVVDIGGGTTDIAVFSDGAIKHTAVIPVAGMQVTNDIAVALKTSTENAEAIKIKYGCASKSLVKDSDLVIELPTTVPKQGQQITQKNLADVIEPRFEELSNLIKEELRRANLLDNLGAGVVLTGGSSKIFGILPLVENILNIPVRLGTLNDIIGLSDVVKNPIYATGVGLLIYAQQHQGYSGVISEHSSNVKSVLGRLKHWFQGNF